LVAISASLLCGGQSFQAATAAEPDAAPVATAAPAADAAARAVGTAETAAPAAQAAPAAAAKAEAATATAASAKPAAATGDDEIVCKKQDVFGSRVRKTKICRTKREWQMEAQAAKDYTKGINKGSAPGPGGEGLPTGG
jgi:hypothetical protein